MLIPILSLLVKSVYYASRKAIAYITHVSIHESLSDNSYRLIIDHLHYNSIQMLPNSVRFRILKISNKTRDFCLPVSQPASLSTGINLVPKLLSV